MVRFYTLLLFLFCSFSMLNAQDIHLTQYYFSPLNYNPSYTGRFDGDYRIVGNYRSQWGAIMSNQFTTSAVSYDQNFEFFNRKWSLGAVFLHDNSGVAFLTQNKLLLSFAHNFNWKGNLVSLGIQSGLLHKGVNLRKLTYPDQYNNVTGGFDNSMPTNQIFNRNNSYLPDVNLGATWGRKLSDKFFPEIGGAWMHLTQPKETFLGDTDSKLQIRSIYDVKLNYFINPKWTITPTLLWMNQNKASEMLFGAMAKHYLNPNKVELTEIFGAVSFRDGFNRNYDAFALIFGGKIKEFQVGISYDFNISPLSSITHYRGAFELSIIYIAKRTTPNIISVPCDRL